MTAQAFIIQDGAFVVSASDGSSAFDSRLQTQRIYLSGVIDVIGRDASIAHGRQPGVGVVPFSKTFANPPYVLSAARKITAFTDGAQKPVAGVYPPNVWLIANNGVADDSWSGFISECTVSQLVFGNFDKKSGSNSSTIRVWYSVFENSAGV